MKHSSYKLVSEFKVQVIRLALGGGREISLPLPLPPPHSPKNSLSVCKILSKGGRLMWSFWHPLVALVTITGPFDISFTTDIPLVIVLLVLAQDPYPVMIALAESNLVNLQSATNLT